MSDISARIGPNAILQLVPVLEEAAGLEITSHILAMAGVIELPDAGAGLMDEGPAARLHQAMRLELPDVAPRLACEAGRRTGEYILKNRIPLAAQRVLRLLPARLSAPLLARAVAKHAWTFLWVGPVSSGLKLACCLRDRRQSNGAGRTRARAAVPLAWRCV